MSKEIRLSSEGRRSRQGDDGAAWHGGAGTESADKCACIAWSSSLASLSLLGLFFLSPLPSLLLDLYFYFLSPSLSPLMSLAVVGWVENFK